MTSGHGVTGTGVALVLAILLLSIAGVREVYRQGTPVLLVVGFLGVALTLILLVLLASYRQRIIHESAALRASEERYRRLVEGSPDPIAVHIAGRLVWVNESGLRAIGAEVLGELEGKPMLEFVHPDDRTVTAHRMKRVLEARLQADCAEARFVRLDGRIIDAEVVSLPIEWDAQPAAQVIFRDITERKRAERALETERTRLREVIAIQHAIAGAGLDLQGVMNLVAARAQALFNADVAVIEMVEDAESGVWSAARFAPKHGENEDHNRSRSRFVVRHRAGLAWEDGEFGTSGAPGGSWAGAGSVLAAPLLHHGNVVGALKVYAGRIAAFTSNDADILRLMAGLVKEALSHAAQHEAEQALLSERTSALTALEEREELYRALMETAPDAIVIADSQGVVVAANSSLERVFGRAPRDLVGEDIASLLSSEHRAELRRRFRTETAGGAWGKTALRGLRPDGEIFPLEVSLARFKQADRWLFAAFFRDMTERERAEVALQASEERFRAVFEGSAMGINLTDEGGHYVTSNPAFQAMVGYSPEELGRISFADITHPDDLEADLKLYRELVSGRRDLYRLEKRYIRRDGAVVWVRLSVSRFKGWRRGLPGNQDDAGDYLICMVEDISERKRAEAALRSSEHHHRLLVELSPEPVAVYVDGHVVYANPSALHAMGAESLDQVVGRPILDFIHPEDQAQAVARAQRVLGSHEKAELVEERFVRLDGRIIDVEVVSIPMVWEGRPAAQTVFRDVTQRKRFEEQLHYQALHDGLTGLPNRTLLRERLEGAIRQAEVEGSPAALIVLDLNRFKDVNDTYGHQLGDRILEETARRLAGSTRATDTAARLSGDEFAVVMPMTDAAAATLAVERMVQVFNAPFVVDGHVFNLAASAGIALYPDHGADVGALMRHADVAMYTAKRTGRSFLFYAVDQHETSPERLQMVWELRTAIEANELVLHYQPQVNLATGQVEQVEALVRWLHPRRGLIPPAAFLEVAEQYGLMTRLTEWVLQEALRQATGWQAAGHGVRIAVNISARTLHDDRLISTIEGLLAQSGLSPSALLLEITESAIMLDPATASRMLKHLHDLGVGLAVDDFGTGYSTLLYLQHLPVDEIKVDRSFVRDMATNSDNAHIVRTVIDLAHNLDKRVVAEGVEDATTMEALKFLGCDLVQGYYVSRPLPQDEYSEWLIAHQTQSRTRTAGA